MNPVTLEHISSRPVAASPFLSSGNVIKIPECQPVVCGKTFLRFHHTGSTGVDGFSPSSAAHISSRRSGQQKSSMRTAVFQFRKKAGKLPSVFFGRIVSSMSLVGSKRHDDQIGIQSATACRFSGVEKEAHVAPFMPMMW